jgi:methionyl-tRNA formyltransferase
MVNKNKIVNSQSSIVNKQRVVFFGAGPYVLPIIDSLNKNYDLSLVVTTEKNPNDSVLSFCSKNGIEYISVNNCNSPIINNKLSIINAELAVLASFGVIVPKQVLELFPLGIINVHPSLLPKYRGATPGQAAILAGDSETGVSIIKLDEEVDHGPVLTQAEEKIEPNDTSETLYQRLFQRGAELLLEVLPKYISGELKPREQDHSKATFTDRLTRETGSIEFSNPPNPAQLDRMIRAYYPWPGVWLKVSSKFKVKNSKLQGKIIKLLPEGRIQVEGKKIMSYNDFINGYGQEGREILAKLNL